MAVVKVGGWDNAWPPWSTWKVDALQHALLLKSPKKSICVYGASTSGSTLCGSPAANGRGRITLDLALIRLRTTPETETELGALRAAPSWPPADVETPSTPSRTGSSRPHTASRCLSLSHPLPRPTRCDRDRATPERYVGTL